MRNTIFKSKGGVLGELQKTRPTDVDKRLRPTSPRRFMEFTLHTSSWRRCQTSSRHSSGPVHDVSTTSSQRQFFLAGRYPDGLDC